MQKIPKILKITVSFILFLMSSLANSADLCTTWGCVSTVSDLYTNTSGLIYVGTPLDETNANCTPYSGQFFILDPASPNADMVYSTLLAAYISGKKVQLRIIEGSSNCKLAYVRLQADF